MATAQIKGTVVPAARVDDLVMTESGSELVVYDRQRHHIHHLNSMAAAVWRLCDGRRSVANLAEAATGKLGIVVSEDSVQMALRQLADADLLEGSLSTAMAGTSRRSFLRKAAVAAAIPAIVSVSAPTAANAGSKCADIGATCNKNKPCCTGTCTSDGSTAGTCVA